MRKLPLILRFGFGVITQMEPIFSKCFEMKIKTNSFENDTVLPYPYFSKTIDLMNKEMTLSYKRAYKGSIAIALKNKK